MTTSAMRSPRSVRQRGDAAREVVEPVRDLAGGAALVDVVVPVADLGEGDLEADVGLGELRDLRSASPNGERG